jgi:hypothetical protein
MAGYIHSTRYIMSIDDFTLFWYHSREQIGGRWKEAKTFFDACNKEREMLEGLVITDGC